MDIKIAASGHIRVWWALPNAFANYKSPTAAEINASLDLSDAISWNDFDFGLQASNTTDDPAITAKGKVSDRGAAQFGGGISLYYPESFDDDSNLYSQAYDALDQPRTVGYVVVRIDGEELSELAVEGDIVHVFRVMTDGYAESITGEEAFRYTVTLLSQGDLQPNAVVAGAGAPVVVVSPDAPTIAVGESLRLTGTLNGRTYTNGLDWTSSDNSLATVSEAGVVTRLSAGSVTITGTDPASGSSDSATAA